MKRIYIIRSLICILSLFGFASMASAQECLDSAKLPGVTSSCKNQASVTEIDTSLSTYWFDHELQKAGVSCAPDVCVAERGSTLCGAVAAIDNKDGAWRCATDCKGTVLANRVSNQICPEGQTCCQITEQEQAAGAGGAKKPSAQVLPDPLGNVNITVIIGSVIRAFAGIAGSIALVMFVWGGLSMILSGGNPDKVTKARQTLINSAIGIVLIFGAFTFVSALIDAIVARST